MSFDVRVTADQLVTGSHSGAIGVCGCGTRWVGLKVCHCMSCHLGFTSINSFDQHRTGRIDPHDPEKDTRRCRTEDELRAAGLEPNENGLWRKPRPADSLPSRED